MRYITHYTEYPIYENAEGGYYYAGNAVSETERLSKRAAKKKLEQIWKECKAENLELFGTEEPTECDGYPWIRIELNYGVIIKKDSKYIGNGESFIIERKLGSCAWGYKPYC